MMKKLLLITVLAFTSSAFAQAKIKYALGDVIGIDDLPLLVAAERSKKRGVEIEITPFKNEDIATQAVINGQADIGQGTPYAAIENVNVPIRFFVQLWSLQFFPVVANEHYKGWKDLDGQEIAVQGRGSGTEAIMLLMAKTHGIKYKNVSYVPGSQVRALAMLKGNIRATILDSTNKNFLLKEGGSKFAVLPLGEVKASDEALFARLDWLQKNQQAVSVFVEELVRVNREINKDPMSIVATRKQLGLLKDLPAKLDDEIPTYFKDGVASGIFPNDGGVESGPKNDLEFYALSGSIKKENPKVEDYWYLAPLKTALSRLK
jgi:NitT/TauT family transport system substrate-binding protein